MGQTYCECCSFGRVGQSWDIPPDPIGFSLGYILRVICKLCLQCDPAIKLCDQVGEFTVAVLLGLHGDVLFSFSEQVFSRSLAAGPEGSVGLLS
jgi:hypothetical protein